MWLCKANEKQLPRIIRNAGAGSGSVVTAAGIAVVTSTIFVARKSLTARKWA